jgi:DNA-binding SARP family transcriptional activator
MSRLDIKLLGPPQISIDGAPAPGFDYAKVLALLLYLAVEQGRIHGRDALAELLWPEQPSQAGRSSLRQALARLRHAIADQDVEPRRLLVTRETVQLNPAAAIGVDAAEFAELLRPAAGHDHRDPVACPDCLERWARAVELYRGPLAEAPAPRDALGYEEWLHARREWFASRQLDTLARLADAHEALGDPAQALAYARRALELDPWRESAHRQAMRLLAAVGERGAALAQYERCRRTLADELGIEPEEETASLYQAIKASGRPDGQAGAAPARPEEGGTLAEPPDSQPVAPSPSSALAPAPLPAPPTSFVGRESELEQLRGLLARPGCRLLTLLGPGGTGKTRLAIELAAHAAPAFADGVCWSALADLSSVDELPGALARALGAQLDNANDPRASLRDIIGQRELLIVLDNVEHLVEGAGLVAELLAAAPRLRVLATSRERLQLQAEWVFDVVGLSFPGAAAGPGDGETDAVRLLLERAGQLQRAPADEPEERAAAVAIARMVEGNPLALELAAAVRRRRSFAAISTALEADVDLLRVTLRDVPERHRSVRAAIEYSWRLLSPAERRAMTRLAIFRGGLAPEAALGVANADEEMLEGLVDKSMLRCSVVSEAGAQRLRFELHELLRRFAAEQLVAAGEAQAARLAHLAWCLSLAEMAEPLVNGAEQERWLSRLEAEHANLRAAIAYALDSRLAEPAQRIGAALTRFWWMRGHLREGQSLLQRSLELEGGTLATRARALHGEAALATQRGDIDRARELMERSLELERQVGRKLELSRILNNLAFVYINLGDYERAEILVSEALVYDRELGDERGVAFDLGTLAQAAHFQGNYSRAVELLVESLAGHRKANDTHSVAVTLLNLAAALFGQGELHAAQPYLDEALLIFRALGSAYGIAFVLLHVARIAYSKGEGAAARATLAECLPLLSALGVTGELAGALSLAARLALDAGEERRGARLWGAAMELLDGRDATLQPPDMLDFGLQLAQARARVAADVWAAGWAEGRSLSTEGAVAEALWEKPQA